MRYLIFCVCIIWSNLWFAKKFATDFEMLARKMHHCNGPNIQKQFYLSIKRYKRNSAMCLVATLEKKELKAFASVKHPNHVIEQFFLNPLYDWMTNLGSIPSSSFLDLIDFLNLIS